MRLTTLICAIGMLIVSGCASVNTKVYDSAQLNAVDSWVLEFAYEAGSVEQLKKSSGDSELKVVSEGHTPRDLQLRDDIYYILKDEYSIQLAKTATERSGKIWMHPIHFYSGGFKLLTVTLVDSHGETLARMKVENGDRNATFKDDDDFTRYAAEAIAEAIRGK